MAISDLLPRKAMGSKSRRQTLKDRLDYDQKEEKTQDGEYITSYMCCPRSAADEFEMSKWLYEQNTGRSQPKGRDIIAYRILQSFMPGEISPEEANQIGYELAMAFTKGKHQFVVSTHTDKAHIHTHIEFNSTNLDCNGKFNNFKNSAFALRELNDKLCREHGLSIIEHPKERGQRFAEKAAAKHGRSFKERLRQTIESVLPASKDFEDFLARMRAEGYEIKQGKYLEFRAPEQMKFTRSFRLGPDYTEKALFERITGRPIQQTTKKTSYQADGRKVNLLIDIQAKMQAGKGKGYERWATIFNLKEAAKTLNFLTDNGISDYDELEARVGEIGERFDAVALRIKQLEGRMKEVAQLKAHIINYSKTRDVYAAYKKSRHKKEFRAEHLDEIVKHEAAKAAFDGLAGKPIPKVAQLSEQYATLLAEKKERYEEYKDVKKEMLDLWLVKQNVDRILGIAQPARQEKDVEH